MNQATNNIDQVILCQGTLALRYREIKLPIELVASNTAKVIAAGIEEHVLDKRTGIIDGSRITGAHLFIEFEQSLILFFNRVSIQCCLNVTDVDIVIYITERIENALVG